MSYNFLNSFLSGFSFGMLTSTPMFGCFNSFFTQPCFYFNPYPIFPPMPNFSIFNTPMQMPSFYPIWPEDSIMPSFNFSSPQYDFNNNSIGSNFVFQQSYPQSQAITSNTDTFEKEKGVKKPAQKTVQKQTQKEAVNIQTAKAFSSASVNNTNVEDLSWWKEQGYNEEKGKKLVQTAMSSAKSKSSSQCATYVKRALQKSLGVEYKSCNGCNVGNVVLKNNKNFKLVYDSSKDGKRTFKSENIPAGAVVIYPSRGYSSNPAGHCEISDGNGHGVSDYISKKLFYNWGTYKNPSQIWIPV